MPRGAKIQEYLQKKLRDRGTNNVFAFTHFDKHQAKNLLDSLDTPKKTAFYKGLIKLVDPEARLDFVVYTMTEHCKLKAGRSFGEVALQNGSARSMTVTCSQDCKFATIHRRDYLVIKTKVRRRKLHEICTYLRDFRIFKHLEKSVIERLWRHMT